MSFPAKEKLKELTQLPLGWDGYQGVPVNIENASLALRVLNTVNGPTTPQIVPGPDGDLQIEWHTLKGDIELYVRAPNNVHAWRALANGEPDGEELELTDDFSAIAAWVREIAVK